MGKDFTGGPCSAAFLRLQSVGGWGTRGLHLTWPLLVTPVGWLGFLTVCRLRAVRPFTWQPRALSGCPREPGRSLLFYDLALKSQGDTSALAISPPRVKGRKHRSHLSVGTVSKSHCEQSMWDGDSVAANFGKHSLAQVGTQHEQMNSDYKQRRVEGAP